MRHEALLAVALTLALSGCKSACDVERLPHQGLATTSEGLFEILQYAAREDCRRTAYDRMSAATREEYGYWQMWLAFSAMRIPEPWDYDTRDVVAYGQMLGVFPHPRRADRELVFVSYKEPNHPELLAQLLIVEERDEEGREVKRLGLVEQMKEGPPINQDPPPGE